ncbi:ABC transporter permease subunit [Eubacteriales bacterium mix99]
MIQLSPRRPSPRRMKVRWKDNISLFLMTVPGILVFICFSYMPLYGLLLAFKNFIPRLGIWGSPWVGSLNFQFMYNNATFWLSLRNTLLYNAAFLVTGIICPMLLAIGLNELLSKKLARTLQTFVIMPHFVSYVVVSVIVFALCSADNGMIAHLLDSIGSPRIAFYSKTKYWPWILNIIHIWKSTGYSSIIYMGALTGISDEYYEAAVIDGATKWQQTRYITIPFLIPMTVILAILRVGGMFSSNFDLFYQVPLNSGQLYPVTNTIDVFVYNMLRTSNNVSLSSAAGFFQSLCGFILVVTVNWITRKIDPDLAMF